MTIDAGALTEAIWNRLCELPDRNSPEDDPEACVCSITELRGCVGDALDELDAAPAPSVPPAALTDDEWLWMTHPTRNGGKPVPVRIVTEDGSKWFMPFDEDGCEFEWEERDEDWRIVTASPADQVEDARVEDLAMLVRGLVRALRAVAPRHVGADEAVRYLKCKGLQGSPLRAAIHETPQDS
ncbi:hypothetical protein [Cupriavidus sp. BIC8F]|uniref:hypothetical protein n=1 Tax=Cupriavidus sp. BIC8F TaxID=3079014 RepID=UPI002916436C|nr:hypothetical protein [Cupriavidus sp. BIC8F]